MAKDLKTIIETAIAIKEGIETAIEVYDAVVDWFSEDDIFNDPDIVILEEHIDFDTWDPFNFPETRPEIPAFFDLTADTSGSSHPGEGHVKLYDMDDMPTGDCARCDDVVDIGQISPPGGVYIGPDTSSIFPTTDVGGPTGPAPVNSVVAIEDVLSMDESDVEVALTRFIAETHEERPVVTDAPHHNEGTESVAAVFGSVDVVHVDVPLDIVL